MELRTPPPFMLYPVIMRYCFKEHGEPCNSPFPPPPPHQKKGYKQIEYTEYFELRIIFSLSVFLRLSYVLFVYIFVCYLFCLFQCQKSQFNCISELLYFFFLENIGKVQPLPPPKKLKKSKSNASHCQLKKTVWFPELVPLILEPRIILHVGDLVLAVPRDWS